MGVYEREPALADAKFYRDQAIEIRMVAAMVRLPETYRTLITAAMEYERIADDIEIRDCDPDLRSRRRYHVLGR